MLQFWKARFLPVPSSALPESQLDETFIHSLNTDLEPPMPGQEGYWGYRNKFGLNASAPHKGTLSSAIASFSVRFLYWRWFPPNKEVMTQNNHSSLILTRKWKCWHNRATSNSALIAISLHQFWRHCYFTDGEKWGPEWRGILSKDTEQGGGSSGVELRSAWLLIQSSFHCFLNFRISRWCHKSEIGIVTFNQYFKVTVIFLRKHKSIADIDYALQALTTCGRQ